MSKGLKAIVLLTVLFSCLNLFALQLSAAQPSTLPNLKIGANLKEYKKPSPNECDTTVSPNESIQLAIDLSNQGDVICVAPGEFNEDVIINKSIRLSGAGSFHPSDKNPTKHTSIINGQNLNFGRTIYINASDVILEGFEIYGAGDKYTSGAVTLREAVSNVTVRYNNIISGNGELALLAGGFQSNNLIQHNVLVGTNSPQVAKINGAPGVGKPSDNVDFINNTFEGTAAQVVGAESGIVLVQHATNSSMNYNVFNTTGTVNEVVQNAYASPDTTLNFNNFNSDAVLWKVANGVGALNAENNWWGDLDPSDDVRNNMVDYDPFATSAYKEY